MSTLDVCWLSVRDGTPARGYWDQGLLEDLLAGRFGPVGEVRTHHHPSTMGEGGLVIVPARHHVDHLDALNDALGALAWAVVVLTGDEEAVLDWGAIDHPRATLWVQPGHPDRGDEAVGRFGWGYAPHVPELCRDHGCDRRPVEVAFAGQVTHERREAAVAAIAGLDRVTEVHPSAGFTQGLAPPDYVSLLCRSQVVACPSGPVHPDTFRIYETIEAGAVPIVDGYAPGFDHAWWPGWQWGGEVPFPVITDWADLGAVVDEVLADWDTIAARCGAWWLDRCRDLRRRLLADVAMVSS